MTIVQKAARTSSTCVTSSMLNIGGAIPWASTALAPMPVRQRQHRSRHSAARRKQHSSRRKIEAQERYPAIDRLMVTADGGGSDGSRVPIWHVKLQELSDDHWRWPLRCAVCRQIAEARTKIEDRAPSRTATALRRAGARSRRDLRQTAAPDCQ